jgi:trehalose 6-phosphate phosphatase
VSLEAVRDRLARAAVILDYDGTLAPIVDRPEDAAPLSGAAEVLADLAPRVGRLAIVTGRPAAFVRRWLPDVEVAGLYGAGDAPVLDPSTRAALAAAAGAEPGAELEDKGSAAAIHTRRADDPEGALSRLAPRVRAIAEGAGLTVRPGKLVLDVTPPGAGKAGAALAIAEGADAVLIAGDDAADVEAFAAIGGLRGPSGVSVCRVAVTGAGVPEQLTADAELVVDGPEGLLELLRGLAR